MKEIISQLREKIKVAVEKIKDVGEDKKYAKVLEEFLKLKIDYIEVEKEKAIETIPEVIKI